MAYASEKAPPTSFLSSETLVFCPVSFDDEGLKVGGRGSLKVVGEGTRKECCVRGFETLFLNGSSI